MLIKESDLYDPLKTYLEHQGYTIGAEIQDCDLIAIKADEMIIIELKTRVSVDLLIQAARRKDISDAVYIAVPLPVGKKDLPKSRGLKNLLRKLEVGLILVRFMKTKTRVDVVLHPRPYEKRMRPGKQASILREVDGRYGEFNKGGIPSTEERITAYKQEAIRIALLLREKGDSSPKDLRSCSARPDKIQAILAQNHYGWFDRVSRGLYRINPAGCEALDRYEDLQPDLMAIFREHVS